MKRIIYICCSFLFLIIILLYPIQSYEGAKAGLNLWFHTIIPTLLPFIILSNLMIQLNATDSLSILLSPLTHKPLKISRQGNYAIFIGMLCGYPMGAKAASDLVLHNKITKAEGQYLLSFCNNVSPMFIVSFIVHTTLKTPELLTKILIILYGAPLISALFFNLFFRKKAGTAGSLPVSRENQMNIDFSLVDSCIIKSFEIIVKLGGYIILFSILSTFFIYFLDVNESIKAAIIGFTEITNGIAYTGSSSYISQNTGILIICVMTSFGGLSSLAQTQSIIKDSGLSIFLYFISKLINGIFAFVLASIIL